MPPTPDNFFGREEELATLWQLWDQATTKDANSGPRMAIILAETGYGKTRLIQALYQQLTNHQLWDPAEVNYWPDAFQEVSNQLRVNPDMTKHSPKGPPRFLWAGMRWFSPEERNLEERTCSLPEIRDVLRTHVEISRQHSDIWTKLKAKAGKAIKTDGISQATEQIVDFLGIPFGGLLLKGVKAIGNLATAKSAHSFEEESENKATDITEELLGDFREIFGAVGSGGVVLPTILFLDDAQWIDPITFKFIGQLWREAESKKWQLFVVITHWERNWRELLRKPENEHESSLAYFKNKKGIHLIELGPSSEKEQKSYLGQKLAGLTESQKNLISGKSGGNFLILVQNVNFLLQNKLNFENGDFLGRLSKSGENRVNNWKPNPSDRIEQMFASLSDETKNLLGWSGQLGIRFIKNVVIDFASKQGIEIDLNRLIDECIDPLVILGKASENIREFRHRAFYQVASQHFRDYLSDSERLLKSTLQKHLSQWVNNSFTSEGELVEIDETIENEDINAAIWLESGERRDLLEMAVREFMPENSQGKDLNTWIRSVYLLISTDSEDNLWDLVREKGNLLKEVNWNVLLNSVLGLSLRKSLADSLETSGLFRSAKRIRLNVLCQKKLLNEQLDTPESLCDIAICLNGIGDIEKAEGNLDTARSLYAEGLDISRKLAEQLNTLDSLRNVSISLERVGDIEKAEGNLDTARVLFVEGLEISRKLAEQINTPESLRDITLSLEGIGNIEVAEGNLDTARVLFAEGLEISRKLAEQLNTPDSLRYISRCLYRIGDIEKTEGNLDTARTLYAEFLEINRKLAKQLNTPESLHNVSISLERVGDIEKAEGNLDTARVLFAEGLEISRKLAEQLNTPESLHDIARCLYRIGDIEKAEGNLDIARTLYAEFLKISRKLVEQLNTPESLRYVSLSLVKIGDIEVEEGNLECAGTSFSECLDISRKLAKQMNTPESWNDISVSLERIGDLEVAKGNLDTARVLYAESLEISRKLTEQLNTPDFLRNISVYLYKIGDIEVLKENMGTAKTLYSEGFEISRKLAKQLNTPESLRDVSVSLYRIGGIEVAEGNLDTARVLYAESLEIRRKLAEQLKTPESLLDVSVSLLRVGDIEVKKGDLDSARTLYVEGLDIRRKLAEQLKTPDSLSSFSVSLDRIGGIEVKEENLDSAKKLFLESFAINRKLAEQFNMPVNINQKIWTLQQLAHVQILLEENQAAFNLLKESESDVDELQSKCSGDVGILDTVATYWERRTEVEVKLKLPEAKNSKAKAEAIRNEIENKKAK